MSGELWPVNSLAGEEAENGSTEIDGKMDPTGYVNVRQPGSVITQPTTFIFYHPRSNLVKKKTLSLPVVPLLSVLPVSVVIVSHDIHEVKVLVQLGQVVGDGNLQKTRTH